MYVLTNEMLSSAHYLGSSKHIDSSSKVLWQEAVAPSSLLVTLTECVLSLPHTTREGEGTKSGLATECPSYRSAVHGVEGLEVCNEDRCMT